MNQEEIIKMQLLRSREYQEEIDKLEIELQELRDLKEILQKDITGDSVKYEEKKPKEIVVFEEGGIRVEKTFWDSFKIINNSDFEIGVSAKLDRRGRAIDGACFTWDFGIIPSGSYEIGNLHAVNKHLLYAGDIIHANIYFKKYDAENIYNNPFEFDRKNPTIRWETEILIEENIL